MAETTIAPGNKLQAYQRAPRREKPRMSAFLGESQYASDGGRWIRQRQRGGPVKGDFGAPPSGMSMGERGILMPPYATDAPADRPLPSGRAYPGSSAPLWQAPFKTRIPARKRGGLVRPAKRKMHLIIMIGLKPKVDRARKAGLISDKAAAKRGLA